MRRFMLITLATATFAVAPTAVASAQLAPASDPILTRIESTPMVELWDGGGGLPYLGSSTSYNAGDWENTLRTYVSSKVYVNQLGKVDAVAERWLNRSGHGRYKLQRRRGHLRGVKIVRASRRTHGHAYGKQKPAIVFDVDETALSNYSAIDKDNFTFGPNSQAEAVNEIGTAIAPTLELYKLAQQRGIATFFITGRRENTRAHTASNLQREGYTGYKALVLKPDASTDSTVVYKSNARKAIEDQGYRILANVGDQYSDLAGGHEAVAFKLPNPFYFLP